MKPGPQMKPILASNETQATNETHFWLQMKPEFLQKCPVSHFFWKFPPPPPSPVAASDHKCCLEQPNYSDFLLPSTQWKEIKTNLIEYLLI